MNTNKGELIATLNEISELYVETRKIQLKMATQMPNGFEKEEFKAFLAENPELFSLMTEKYYPALERLNRCNNGLVPEEYLFAVSTLNDFLKANMADDVETAIATFLACLEKLFSNGKDE